MQLARTSTVLLVVISTAAAGYAAYSGSLLTNGTVWTPENLFAFLEKPSAWAPGTTMGFAGLKKPEDRANVIAYLDSLDD